MIQLNLLPDVKQQYINAQRQRRLITSISLLVMAVAVALLVILFAYNLAQKKHLTDLSRDISNKSVTLEKQPNINTVLTVQNQLESLTTLHAAKPAASNLFSTYLTQITPASVNISSFHIDFTTVSGTITGTADTLSSVNQYVDTLKKTTYITGDNGTAEPAFSDVVLTSFGLNSSSQQLGQAASYTISFAYDRTIFDITQSKITLSVPQITTRADVNQPAALFKAAPKTTATATNTTTTNGGGQ